MQALIEPELRRTMERDDIEDLPLYPEERTTRRPTAEQIFRLFCCRCRFIFWCLISTTAQQEINI